MIVCLCTGLSEKKLREMADQGRTAYEIMSGCNAGLSCGSCVETIRSMTSQQKPHQTKSTPKEARGN